MASWADRLGKVNAGINISPHAALHDVAPMNVESKPDLVFELRREAAFGMKHNSEVIESRADALEKEGAYRTIAKQKYEKGRGFKPQFSREIHNIERVEGNRVIDDKGESIPTKRTQPTPKDTERKQADEARFLRGGSAQTEAKRQRILQPFADGIRTFLREQGGATLTKIALQLPKFGDFRKASLEAQLNQKRVTVHFLETFPHLFKVSIPKRGGSAVARLV